MPISRRRFLTGCGALIAGCGGSSSAPLAVVDATTEAQFTRDALILTARDSIGVRVPLAAARAMDEALRQVRARFPELETVHANQTYDPHELHLALAIVAPWRDAWRRGERPTGSPELDRVLREWEAVSVQSLYISDDREWFSLRFAPWLRMRAAAFLLVQTSPQLLTVSVTGGESVSTEIEAETTRRGTLLFTFTDNAGARRRFYRDARGQWHEGPPPEGI